MANYNQNAGYGQALLNMVASRVPAFGNIFIVMNAANTDEGNYKILQDVFPPDADGRVRFYTSLASAYAACESNNNDVVLLDGNSSHALTEMLTVAKNRVHFFGMDGGGRIVSQGAKITLATSEVTDTAVIKNTGTRNTYRNLKIVMSGTNAAQVNAMEDSGEGTYCENVHFSHTTLLTTVGVSALHFKGDTCNYKHCQIGDATIYRTGAAQMACRLGEYARYSYFENCEFVNASSETTAMLVGTTSVTSVIGFIKFTRCGFNGALLADGTTAGGSPAVAVVAALDSGYILLDECSSYNCDIIASTDTCILNKAQASAATAGGGLSVAGA